MIEKSKQTNKQQEIVEIFTDSGFEPLCVTD